MLNQINGHRTSALNGKAKIYINYLVDWSSYLFTLKDMADHLRRGPYDLQGVFPLAGYEPPPGHDDEEVTDVGDVGDAPEGVVHHDLLKMTFDRAFNICRDYTL